MPSSRVRLSRRLSRRLFASDLLTCTEVHYREHWSEPIIDAAFYLLRRKRGHCRACALWEASLAPEPVEVDAAGRRDEVGAYRSLGLM